jgi:hypothetical protein
VNAEAHSRLRHSASFACCSLRRCCSADSIESTLLDPFAKAYDSFTREMQARCRREMSAAPYFRKIAQTGGQLVSMSSEGFRGYLELLKTTLSEMEHADVSPEPEARPSDRSTPTSG